MSVKSYSRTTIKLFLIPIAFFFFSFNQPINSQTSVFVNEIHYDNASTDAGEAIEIAGPAGTNLSGWQLVLYNGASTSLKVYTTTNLSGIIPNLCGGYGTLVFNYPVNGIQNGDPDGIALVNNNVVVQFLSYGGVFTAADGPANGMISINIGVKESSTTPVGYSLQLTGSGLVYENFTWATASPNTFGACNTNQTFGGDNAPVITSTVPAINTTGIPVNSNITINFSEDVNVSGSWFSIIGSSSGLNSASVSGGPQSFILDPANDFTFGETVTVTFYSAFVTDTDLIDPPDNLAADYTFSFSIGFPQTGWVINEILADPANNISGDANGDGVINTSQDEFVEIVNNTGEPVNISGWALSDGVGVRHVFPFGTIIPHQGAIVVFAGGTPTGTFGEAIVQTASTGQLGLNNTGDRVALNNGSVDVAVYIYGSEGGTDQSITRDPDITGPEPLIRHALATGSGGALFSPGTQVNGMKFPGSTLPPVVKEIFEIQGPGLSSPFTNQVVTTRNNVVTAVGNDGFFIQTPSEKSDNDISTSDGIFVYTGTAPSVSAGDLVDVTAKVIEYYGFTEFSNPEISIVGTGQVPTPVPFNSYVPSPDQPQSSIEYEKYEGMLISIDGGTVTESNQRFASDINAEVYIVAGSNRAFREKGVQFPGLGIPSIPVWDGNPEVFELDPDRLGLQNRKINAGSSFDATGVLGYEFSGYEFWPISLTVREREIPVPVRSKTPDEFTVGSLNTYRLFDAVKDGTETVVSSAEYSRRLNKASLYIREVLNSPDILAVQEVEKLGVLVDLLNKITSDDPSVIYVPYLEEGNDIGGIDVGFLVRQDRVAVNAVTQLNKYETFIDPADGSVDILHDRPPLQLDGSFIINGIPSYPITVIAVHNRSLSDLESPTDGPRVRQKRLEQAQSIARTVQALQTADPEIKLVVTGDFNAYQFTDGYVDAVGQIMGDFIPEENLLSGEDLVNPNLINQVLNLPPEERYSYSFNGSAQVLDHSLTSSTLSRSVTGFAYGRGNADAAVDYIYNETSPLRCSDHDGLVLFVDATAPQIVLNEPTSIWPPNGKYTTFTITDFVQSVSDNGIQLPIESVYISKATSDEEEDAVGNGDANTLEDILIVDCSTIKLRAERAGSEDGRVYKVYLAAQDNSGNITTVVYSVGVPKSVKETAVAGIEKYVVLSNCVPPQINSFMIADNKSVSQQIESIPTHFVLEQNYPNPFNPETIIRFSLPEAGYVSIKIYDALGREVASLIDNHFNAGSYNAVWNSKDRNGSNVSSGIYFYRIQAGNFVDVKKMLLIR
jgi:hypothetical protein